MVNKNEIIEKTETLLKSQESIKGNLDSFRKFLIIPSIMSSTATISLFLIAAFGKCLSLLTPAFIMSATLLACETISEKTNKIISGISERIDNNKYLRTKTKNAKTTTNLKTIEQQLRKLEIEHADITSLPTIKLATHIGKRFNKFVYQSNGKVAAAIRNDIMNP